MKQFIIYNKEVYVINEDKKTAHKVEFKKNLGLIHTKEAIEGIKGYTRYSLFEVIAKLNIRQKVSNMVNEPKVEENSNNKELKPQNQELINKPNENPDNDDFVINNDTKNNKKFK